MVQINIHAKTPKLKIHRNKKKKKEISDRNDELKINDSQKQEVKYVNVRMNESNLRCELNDRDGELKLENCHNTENTE